MVKHNIDPIYNNESNILILGSFPSVKSRDTKFFYGHPFNRFWRVMAYLYKEEVPITIPEKKAFLLRNKIALWDVIKSCNIIGSSDSSIKNVKVNDIQKILDEADIKRIYVNGKKAESLYKKYLEVKIKIAAISLKSSSPANAKCSLEDLIEDWKEKGIGL